MSYKRRWTGTWRFKNGAVIEYNGKDGSVTVEALTRTSAREFIKAEAIRQLGASPLYTHCIHVFELHLDD